MALKNMTIRNEAKKHGVYLWQIAEKLSVAEATFIKKLRHELPNDEQEKIIDIIHDISKEELYAQ